MVSLLCCCQTEAMEAEGFQADTEDDDEDDCVIISTQSGELHRRNKTFFLNILPNHDLKQFLQLQTHKKHVDIFSYYT